MRTPMGFHLTVQKHATSQLELQNCLINTQLCTSLWVGKRPGDLIHKKVSKTNCEQRAQESDETNKNQR